MDVSDATKVAEAFLKIASVYKEENSDVKIAVLDSIGVKLCLHLSIWLLFVCLLIEELDW